MYRTSLPRLCVSMQSLILVQALTGAEVTARSPTTSPSRRHFESMWICSRHYRCELITYKISGTYKGLGAVMVHQRSGCACALVIDTVGVVFFATTLKRRCAGQGCHIVEADTVIIDLKCTWPVAGRKAL
jgi:hypothetical protein